MGDLSLPPPVMERVLSALVKPKRLLKISICCADVKGFAEGLPAASFEAFSTATLKAGPTTSSAGAEAPSLSALIAASIERCWSAASDANDASSDARAAWRTAPSDSPAAWFLSATS
jgi:hypothetical protein